LRPPAVESHIDSHRSSNDGMRLGQMTRNENSDEDMPEQPLTHPDDEWDTKEGRSVVAAGSAIFFVYLGLIYSYGIVQLYLNEARLASLSTLSFIG
jgi:hypothetical protein